MTTSPQRIPTSRPTRTAAKRTQLAFLKPTRSEYGGVLMKKRAGRLGPRPIDTRYTMHLVLRSSKARGEWSFLRYRKSVQGIFLKFGNRYGIRIVSLANVGNHLHLQIKISNRYLYSAFIRAATASIAMRVTGAGKGISMRSKLGEKGSSARTFWDYRPWTRIVRSYRALLNLRDYLAINEMEGQGFDRAEARWFITGRLPWSARGSTAA